MPTAEQDARIRAVLKAGKRLLKAQRCAIDFKTGDPEAERYLNNIEDYPHLFVFGCIMDRQIKYGKAWRIPYRVGQEAGGFSFSHFQALSLRNLQSLFKRNSLHRFNDDMARNFRNAVSRIHTEYDDDASTIWRGTPPSAKVIRRFLEFDGVGIKIATMATNILVREFKVPLTHLESIDISPDVRVTRFFQDIGLLRPDATTSEVVYLARELHPEFPGLLDYGAFMEGEFRR